MTDKIKLPRDVRIFRTRFKAGGDLETFLNAVDRHNKFYERLYELTPRETLLKVFHELHDSEINQGSNEEDFQTGAGSDDQ